MTTTALPPTITDATVTLREAGFIPGITAGEYFGYCNITGVQYEIANIAELPQLVTSPTDLGRSRIAQEVYGAAVELQVELDHFYVMPYTGTDNNILSQLYDLNAKLATARILKRLFAGAETTASAAVNVLETWVTEFYQAIAAGKIRWDQPFGDAQPRAMNPVYDLSEAITAAPSALTPGCGLAASPMFRISTSTRFEQERLM